MPDPGLGKLLGGTETGDATAEDGHCMPHIAPLFPQSRKNGTRPSPRWSSGRNEEHRERETEGAMHVGMGAFFQNLGRATSDHEVWRHQLSLADAAEGLGFGSVWTPEHHFTDYTMSPNPMQFLTWVAARTKRVRLGSMVCVLPWHDPVRLAEEASVLDHASGGRLVLGIGRGLARIEFDGFRTSMAESRRRFVESAEA